VLRVCSPPSTNGHMDGESAAAVERIVEALQTRQAHESLIA
jgi:hypothetical protein